jgi:hypothetical protein
MALTGIILAIIDKGSYYSKSFDCNRILLICYICHYINGPSASKWAIVEGRRAMVCPWLPNAKTTHKRC